ncbi:hypothetical protein S40285_08276 [Stachybotrys chlorohalonatus IBT 40285]|uniref:SGNH hydrolase-type esterase domain-containing protein n=1 Tax=Stachybotrys chlorohalonatus (strain IBT 40285) TaxID=1283841 RepID=A0A084QRL5_STAC4|nr:hypothetical protein S40285_08276 [Stachybotrys chlorohalonata IBT 40285]
MNDAYRRLVQDGRVRDAKCIFLADMEPEGAGKNFMGLNENVWAEDEKGGTVIHPNDEGYRRMAYIFYTATRRALAADRVKPAVPMTISGNGFCDKISGNGDYAGSGKGDGTYSHSSQGPNIRAEIESQWDRNQWRFARLFNRQYDDLVGWYEFGPNNHRYGVWKNSANGQGAYNKIGDHLGNIYCIPRGLHFADVNGDGLDDIVCVSPAGDLHMSLNLGNGGGNTPPSFRYIGSIKTGEAPQDRIRLADIDGDGRVDYGVVADNGQVRFWRNEGTGEKPEYRQALGVRSTMAPGDSGTANLAGIQFPDINGDGRHDWIYMRGDGRTTTYTNARSCKKGRDGDDLHVAWRQTFLSGASSGSSHGGIGYLQTQAEDWRSKIHFARVYGTKPAFGNLGVQDYVYIKSEKVADNSYKVTVNVWKNLGSGGTKLEADGNKYCNMHGCHNGRSDYVWVYSDGRMDLYPHSGKRFVSGGESYWGPWVPDFWRPPGGAQVDRRNLHLADWDGDGACDIMWYPRDKTWVFKEIAAPDLQCNAKDGIGIHDVAVRFAQINTSKKADYLCINPDGLVRARMHSADDGWSNMMQIKRADVADRANLRFADVNGDGVDDIIWVDKFTGDASVWYNGGRHGNPAANSGSYYIWRKGSGNAYGGSYAGTCQNFVNLDSNPRADLHSIMGTWTNNAETWYSPICDFFDNRGDDEGGVRNPQLPIQLGNPLTNPAPKCVAARTYVHSRILINDVITMELWAAGIKVCQRRAAEFFLDNEDYYQWDCPDLENSEII